jgi:hypothetical protein
MPLFLKHRLLFIHIPKCGGDTISHALRQAGDPPFLFVDDGSVMVNGHTPQHLSWRELVAMGWSGGAGFRVAALVRHPVDRVLSAYRYVHGFRPDLVGFAGTPACFLDHFLSEEEVATQRFDHHNKGLLSFLTNEDGSIEPDIHVQPLSRMDVWLRELSLPPIAASERRNVTASARGDDAGSGFGPCEIERIREFYAEDICWYEAHFGR